MVMLPPFWFIFLVLLCLMEGGVLIYLLRQHEWQECLAETTTIKINGGCTVEANAVTLKGTSAAYRLLPVGTTTQ